MKAFTLVCTTLMHSAPAQELLKVSHGKLVRHAHFASTHVGPRHVDVWLPEGYNAQHKYAVLYMHDGQMLYDATTTWNQQAWEVDAAMHRLLLKKEIRPTIVVGIWNGGTTRHIDYFPQRPFESLPQAFRDSLLQSAARPGGASVFAGQIRSNAYLRFVVDELKPFIDAQYATLPDADNTFIMGSSMGGLISMYALCEFPHIFGGAACLSTHWPGIFSMDSNPIPQAFFDYLDMYLPTPGRHKLYFDYGTAGLDSLYPPLQQQADAVLQRRGWKPSHWVTRRFEGADHSENAWKARLHIPLTLLLRP
jgi:predicted alpha/beta superfamily hydrolase